MGAETLMPQREPQVEEESWRNSDPLALPSGLLAIQEARGFTALLRKVSDKSLKGVLLHLRGFHPSFPYRGKGDW